MTDLIGPIFGIGRIVPYVGSKRQLLPAILPRVPEHRVYVEPFAGGAALFFTKPPAQVSVLNDKDRNLIRFYREFSCKKVQACKKESRHTCDYAEKARKKVRAGTASVCEQIAARRFSIVSDVTGGMKKDECKIHQVVTKQLEKKCPEYEARLKSAVLHSVDFKTIVEKYDAKDAFIFMDPPYPDTTLPYGAKGVTPAEVCAVARGVKGKVMVTYNDHPDVRKACSGKGLRIKVVASKHRSKRVTKGNVRTRELLITNY